MSNCDVFTLPTLEVEPHQVREVLRCLLHTIIFNRALGYVTPRDVDSELFDITYVHCGDPEVDAKLERKITEFYSFVEKRPGDVAQLCLSFYHPVKRQVSWFGKEERMVWEQWCGPLCLLPLSDRTRLCMQPASWIPLPCAVRAVQHPRPPRAPGMLHHAFPWGKAAMFMLGLRTSCSVRVPHLACLEPEHPQPPATSCTPALSLPGQANTTLLPHSNDSNAPVPEPRPPTLTPLTSYNPSGRVVNVALTPRNKGFMGPASAPTSSLTHTARQHQQQAALERAMSTVLRYVGSNPEHMPPVSNSDILSYPFHISISGGSARSSFTLSSMKRMLLSANPPSVLG